MSAVYFSSTGPTQATVTVDRATSIPGALYRVVAYNPNGVASNPVTFTITNTLQPPNFLNPGPQTFVGGGSLTISQVNLGASSLTWSISPTTAVTLSGVSDFGVTINVSSGIPIASPTNYTLTAVDALLNSVSQTFTIQNTFNAPAFANPGTKSFTNGGSFSVTQTASGTGQLTWSISPTVGVTLSGAGTGGVTVTVSVSQAIATANYTLTATNPTPTSCVQTFSLTNTITSLYTFSTFTFTPAGATGGSGPTSLAAYGTSYPGYGTSYALAIGTGVKLGMQLWTVPLTGQYKITATGAGAVGASFTSYGRSVQGTYNFTQGQVLTLLVGQSGTVMPAGSTGGCGGSYVVDSSNNPIIIAGGAGGNGRSQSAGESGRFVTSGGAATYASYNADGGAGGQCGNQYTGPTDGTNAGGGGGFNTGVYNGVSGGGGNGQNQTAESCLGGLSFLNGGTGGTTNGTASGGFGGGGAASYNGNGNYAAGGGGGYSGGGGGATAGSGTGGGGGGSYGTTTLYSGVALTDLGASNSGQGSIIITQINPALPVLVNPGNQALNTSSSAQTITVLQTASTASTGTITWTYSTLPTGMTVQSSSGTQIVFSIAQNTTIASQSFTVTATSANASGTPVSVTFSLVAGTISGSLATMTSTGWNSAMGVFGMYALYSASTVILSVRRSTDNVTVDVTSDTVGNWTVSSGGTYSTWIGAATGYATKWWDQSGKGAHMTCSSTGIQPIVNFTNRYLDFKTSAWFDTSATPTTGPVPWDNTKNYTVAARHYSIQTSDGGLCGVSAAAPNYNATNYTNNFRLNTTNYQNYWFFNDVNGGNYAIGNSVTFKWDGTNRYVYSNGTLITTQASSNWLESSSSNQRIGSCTNSSTLNGEMYYITMFNTALSDADRLIINNIGVGPVTPVLSTMTTTAKNSAQAIYGVKALLNATATILTVRRSTDSATTDVISDTVGNYTITGGGSYVNWIGTATAYITKWWDQSTVGNHATQSSTGSQPKFDLVNRQVDFKPNLWLSMPNGTIPYVNTNYTIIHKQNTVAAQQACMWGSGGYGTVRAVNALERGGGGSYAQYWWGDDCAGPSVATGHVVSCKYDNTVGRTIYVNGTSSGTNTSLLRNSTNVNNTIACDWRNGSAGQFLGGELYYLQIYGTAFSDADRAIAESVSII